MRKLKYFGCEYIFPQYRKTPGPGLCYGIKSPMYTFLK